MVMRRYRFWLALLMGLGDPRGLMAAPVFLDPSLDPDFSPPLPAAQPQVSFSLESAGERSNSEAWQRILATYRYDNSWFLTTGYEWYQTWGSDPTQITLVPLRLGTRFQFSPVAGSVALGVDLNSQQQFPLHVDVQATVPLAPRLAPELILTCQSYRGRATSLVEGVYACRPGVNLFYRFSEQWQTFWGYRVGLYSDGNREQQLIGNLSYRPSPYLALGINLFNWSYGQEQPSYFSPPDFLVLTGEAQLTAALSSDLRCRLGITLGQQRLKSVWSGANTYQGECQWQVQERLRLNSQLRFSNVLSQPGEAYNSAAWSLGFQWQY
ncbi:MAG: hypothetical protein Q6K08_01715 [Thermostichales cyanobacterium GMQP_bins_62]